MKITLQNNKFMVLMEVNKSKTTVLSSFKMNIISQSSKFMFLVKVIKSKRNNW